MMDRNNRPRVGSVSDVTPGDPSREDLLTNWPEHVDAYLQYISNVMRMVGAPMGLRADLISLQGRVREQRRPERVVQQPENRPAMSWPAPPVAAPPLERVVTRPGNISERLMETPEGAVRLNLPSVTINPEDLKDMPAQFRQGMGEVTENEAPRDLS